MNEKKKTPTEEYIDAAAEAGAQKVLNIQRRKATINHYRAMEDLLRDYRNTKRQLENPEEYGFFPTGKSHDISVAPPPGLGLSDKVEMNELYVEARKRSYIRTMDKHAEVAAAVKMFEGREEFIVIRMYYFNEDEYGNDRGDNAKRLTWEEIAEALENIGIKRSVSVLRSWRSRIVREMTVRVFGIDGAISIESRENTQQIKKGREEHEPPEE